MSRKNVVGNHVHTLYIYEERGERERQTHTHREREIVQSANFI